MLLPNNLERDEATRVPAQPGALGVSDVDGSVLARLSVVPALYIKQNLKALRRAQPLPRVGRIAALAAAGELFTGTVDGVTLDEHERLVCRASGRSCGIARDRNANRSPRIGW